jgi:hypothetical protein
MKEAALLQFLMAYKEARQDMRIVAGYLPLKARISMPRAAML